MRDGGLALLLATGMAIGILGLGDRLGGRRLGDQLVRGWMALWWVVALAGQLVSPRVAVVVGFAVVAAGLVGLALGGRLRTTALAGVAAVAVGAPLWLLPPVFYDALVYHLGLPWSWLVNGTFAPQAHDLFSRFPLAASTVYLLPVAVGQPEVAAALHWLAFVLALVTLRRVAQNLGAGEWSALAPILLVGCWHAVWLAGGAGADHLVLLGVTVALDRLTAPGDTPSDRLAIGLAIGLALGLAVSAKYTAFVPVAAVLAGACLLRPLPSVAVAAAAAVATSSFWWVRNLVQVGNPFYPLLWNVFGGTGWTALDQQRWAALVHEGGGLAGALRGLAHLVVPPVGLGWWVALAVPPAIAAVAQTGEVRRTRRAVAAMGAVALLGWLATSQTTRYALPAAAIVAILAAAGVAGLSRRLRGCLAGVLGLAVVHGLLTLGGALFGHWQVDRV